MTHPTTTILKRKSARRAAFTLVEMIIVVMVIAILAALALPVFNAAAQQAKVHRTRAIVAKLDQLIGEKYESYRTRAVPVRVAPGVSPRNAAGFRLLAMHELMRFEMPDRITDIAYGPKYPLNPPPNMNIIPSSPTGMYQPYPLAALMARPSVNIQFLLRTRQAHPPGPPPWANTGIEYWSPANENAECLYLILSVMRDGDRNALDWFSKSEIGDTDDDGMNEILDAWGQPIAFLRWAPAYRGDLAPFPVTPQAGTVPDPFDPFKTDARWSNGSAYPPFALKPLIWSAGPDKKHGINVATPILPIPPGNTNPSPYAMSTPANDPYFYDTNAGQPIVGAVVSPDAADNITNHDLEAK